MCHGARLVGGRPRSRTPTKSNRLSTQSRSTHSRRPPPQYAQPQYAQPPAAPSTDDMLEQLQKLGELKKAGVLTEAEFQAQKAKILAG